MSEAKTIYKIFRVAEWEAARAAGQFAGSPDDVRDGFIHFSTAEQLRGTVERYFAGEDEIVLAGFDAAGFGDALKWEVSRGGMKFPHLYSGLPLENTLRVTRIEKDRSGGFVLPDHIC